MTAHTPLSARRSSHWTPGLGEKLESALNAYDWDESEVYDSLSELSQAVEITGHTIDIDSTVFTERNFICPGNVFVQLRYDVNSEDPVYIDDSYPISVTFQVNENEVKIDSISVDTSSFY
jgi:hypothetical protein